MQMIISFAKENTSIGGVSDAVISATRSMTMALPIVYQHPVLTKLGYPPELHTMYAIRRSPPQDVTDYLIRKMRTGYPIENVVRLPSDRDYLLLPLDKGRIEFIGDVADLPKFVRLERNDTLVQVGDGLNVLWWNEGAGSKRTIIIPPGSDKLLKRATGYEPESQEAKDLRSLAEWLERIPLVEPAGPEKM